MTKWKLKRQEAMMNEQSINIIWAKKQISGKEYGIRKAVAFNAMREEQLMSINSKHAKKHSLPMPEHLAYKRRNKQNES